MYTQADLDAVRAEMSKARSVTFADRSTTRRSMDELLALETRILNELGQAQQSRPKQFAIVGSKGLC